jgi:glycosyltransferase involved in cell wall biosynthesis
MSIGSKKIRLMIITHDLAIGGLQHVIVNMCKTINRDVFEPSVLCLRELGDYTEEIEKLGIRVFLIPQKKNHVDYFGFLKVAKILREEKIDIVHTHNTQPFFDGTVGGLIAGVKRIVHTDHARTFPDKLRYMFAEWVLSHIVHKVVAVSEDTAKNLRLYEKIPNNKLMIIPNGIHGPTYEVVIDKEKKKKELGISGRGPVLGIGARLCEQKGIVYLLIAMQAIIKNYPLCVLIIAGIGELEDELRKKVEALRLNEHVKFLGMRMDIPELLKVFDVYVLPSISEGMPLVLLEAMAAQCPIVATDIGGIPSVITTEETGLLVKSKSPQALSAGIIRMLTDGPLREKIVGRAFESFNENYEARIMTQHYEKLYLENIDIAEKG